MKLLSLQNVHFKDNNIGKAVFTNAKVNDVLHGCTSYFCCAKIPLEQALIQA